MTGKCYICQIERCVLRRLVVNQMTPRRRDVVCVRVGLRLTGRQRDSTTTSSRTTTCAIPLMRTANNIAQWQTDYWCGVIENIICNVWNGRYFFVAVTALDGFALHSSLCDWPPPSVVQVELCRLDCLFAATGAHGYDGSRNVC